jgi:hypothetical protein
MEGLEAVDAVDTCLPHLVRPPDLDITAEIAAVGDRLEDLQGHRSVAPEFELPFDEWRHDHYPAARLRRGRKRMNHEGHKGHQGSQMREARSSSLGVVLGVLRVLGG